MYLVGPHLFSGEELETYLADRRSEAMAAVQALDGPGMAGRRRDDLVRELHRRFAVPETGMQVNQAHFTEERPLSADEREAIGVSEADASAYKAVTIAIPYAGDEHLFTCRPTVFSAHQPQAALADGKLHMTWLLHENEEFQLENNFKRQLALIERTLEVTRWQAMGFNQDLAGDLARALDERLAADG